MNEDNQKSPEQQAFELDQDLPGPKPVIKMTGPELNAFLEPFTPKERAWVLRNYEFVER